MHFFLKINFHDGEVLQLPEVFDAFDSNLTRSGATINADLSKVRAARNNCCRASLF